MRMDGHAGHGDRLPGMLAAVRDGQAQRLRGGHRVGEEELEEVAHAEEDQRVGMGGLGGEPLRQGGGGALGPGQVVREGRRGVHGAQS